MEKYPWWMQPAGSVEKGFVFILFIVVAALLTIILL
jgi:hypothetical protein